MVLINVLFLITSLVQIFLCIQFILTRPLFRHPIALVLIGTVLLVIKWGAQIGLYAELLTFRKSGVYIYPLFQRVTLLDGIIVALTDALVSTAPFILLYYCISSNTSGSEKGEGPTGMMGQTRKGKMVMVAALGVVGLVCLAELADAALTYMMVQQLLISQMDNGIVSLESLAAFVLRITVIILRIIMLFLLVSVVWPNRQSHVRFISSPPPFPKMNGKVLTTE